MDSYYNIAMKATHKGIVCENILGCCENVYLHCLCVCITSVYVHIYTCTIHSVYTSINKRDLNMKASTPTCTSTI